MAGNRFPQSQEWLARARQVTPGGSQTLSKMADRFVEGAYPAFLNDGHGARVTDIDGHAYVDWICALGAVTLGYGRGEVDRAVMGEIGQASFSLPTPLEVRVAERLVDLIPCAEMVRFTKTGSEAAEAAIRIARAYTGRDVILSCGYHSWHSWYAATKPYHPGVPRAYINLVDTFNYNDVISFDGTMGDDVAAVIIEPTLIERPAPGFLQHIADACKRYGTVLIFDEMVTGFRWHKAGYQAICGITPDLALFGKGLGNGYAIACVVGNRDLMKWGLLASGTFGGETIGLAAAMGVLDVYEKEDPCELMRGYGSMLFHRYAPWLIGQPPHPKWRFGGDDQMAIFLQETASAGVLFHPAGFNVSAALTHEDFSQTCRAVDRGLEAILTKVPLEGTAPAPHPFRSLA